MRAALLAALAAALPRALGHIALWHPAMYGWKDDQPNQSDAQLPLMHLDFNDWWFHGPGFIDYPPLPGRFMELPAGGTFHGEVSCNKAFTNQWGYRQTDYACDTIGPLHTTDSYASPIPFNVKGCGLAIAYKSNVSDIVPEDFSVISTNYTCPWTREVDFQIPADLPQCPEEGCTCMWGWVHGPDAGEEQMYFLGYRCRVNGASHTIPLPPPQIARKCPVDKSNCTVGSKQPHYWLQNERNNNFQAWQDPPYYNGEYGFANGAQTDLYAAVGGSPAAVNHSPPPGHAPTGDTSATSSVGAPGVAPSISAGKPSAPKQCKRRSYNRSTHFRRVQSKRRGGGHA